MVRSIAMIIVVQRLLIASLQPLPSIEGAYSRTIAIQAGKNNRGLAITSDGTLMAVSNWSTHKVVVYRLPDSALQAEFGGKGKEPGKFNAPQKMCVPPTSASLLITDKHNKRVQVCLPAS